MKMSAGAAKMREPLYQSRLCNLLHIGIDIRYRKKNNNKKMSAYLLQKAHQSLPAFQLKPLWEIIS